MNERPNSAIVPIVSNTDQKTFGTGFVMHQDREFSYLVTCAHVVCDIERKNEAAEILAGGVVAQVKGRGEPEEIDLAVLAVPRWQDRSPLTLARGAESEMSICVWGHCSREDKSALVREQQQGKLAKAAKLVGRRSGEAVTAWYLQFEGSDRPEPGYSGGPVLCGDRVVAVAAIRMADNRVIAIGIEALARVWPEMPPNLIDTLATQTLPGNRPSA